MNRLCISRTSSHPDENISGSDKDAREKIVGDAQPGEKPEEKPRESQPREKLHEPPVEKVRESAREDRPEEPIHSKDDVTEPRVEQPTEAPKERPPSPDEQVSDTSGETSPEETSPEETPPEDAGPPEPPPLPDIPILPERECLTGQKRPCYEGPAQTQGVGECKGGQQVCEQNRWSSCKGQVLPAVTEVCSDKLDNNCDGKLNEGCPCLYLGKNLGVCRNAKLDGKGNCSKPASYATTEICDDTLDNNCNGVVDENCPCFYLGKTEGVCNTRKDRFGQCSQPTKYSPTENCDGLDNNCDGLIDEGNPGGGGSCTASTAKGICRNGTWGCQQGRLQCIPGFRSTEICNGKDDDCDGTPDNLRRVACWGLVGTICRIGYPICQNGQKVCNVSGTSQVQACSNSIVTCTVNCPQRTDGYICHGGVCKTK